MKLSESLKINTDQIRIRKFEVNGQQFKVRVPLTAEAEAIYEKVKSPSPEEIEKRYQKLAEPVLANKNTLDDSEDVKFTKDDIIFGKRSLRELAKTQLSTEIRIVETFKLLVPADGSSMTDLTYDEIMEDIPLPVQLDIVKKISEIISPGYEETQKN